MIRVGLHDYVTDPLLAQKDGANLAHENIAQLLRVCSAPDIDVRFHDFMRLFNDENYALSVLGDLDCVVSNVGPHAHYYFWLREKLGLDFRIIRDVRTAIWSSYLLQEHLCQPMLRGDDTLLVASRYTLDVYHGMFPHLSRYPSAICYPLTICFPETRPIQRASPQPGSIKTLGYLGRLSEDKNFPSLIELLVQLNLDQKNSYRLIACGEVHSPSCAPDLIRKHLQRTLGDDSCFSYRPPCNHEKIWAFLSEVDVLLFPSTSNLETLGRVLIEASYARIPVVAGDHAAAPELVDPAGLCPVQYEKHTKFNTHFDHALGHVPYQNMINALKKCNLRASNCYEVYSKHPVEFINLLSHVPAPYRNKEQQRQTPLLEALNVELPPAPDRAQAMNQISECAAWFVSMQSKDTDEYTRRAKRLLSLSRYPERTQRYLFKNTQTAADFTNIGGIDIELCHLLQFYPQFSISSQTLTPSSNS